ncbi:MAG: hypothetical protein EHM33_02085 [Chloroflexi bacterium]|nr:MAG: hypothetical protein EHM33_02085 [Chloroflexota bacterium]
MNASALSDNLYKTAYEVIHPIGENGKRVTRCKASTLPVLSHLLITDHEGRLAFYSHDIESAVVSYSPARIDEPFSICVPAHPFLDWMEIIKNDPVRVDLTMDAAQCLLIVQAGNARATFKCMDAMEFPSVAAAQEPGQKDPTLASVGLAVSKDDARPEYKRICYRDGYMAATDGLRLHLAPSEKTDIPEGFPDVNKILETLTAPGYTVVVPASLLGKAVKSLKAMSKKGDGLVTFHCNGSIEITAQTPEGDASRAAVEVLNSTGGEVEFTLSIQYVLDALTHVSPKIKTPKGQKAELQTVSIHVIPNPNPFEIPAPVWFVNGDLKAAIMPKYDRVIPEGTAKPGKSELMSAYNRKRAQLRREGKSTWELNRAFGDLQRKNWQEVTPEHAASYTLLGSIVQARAAHTVTYFKAEDMQKVYDFISAPQDPAAVAARQITRPEYEPHPETPAYRWCNQTQCYTLNHSPK